MILRDNQGRLFDLAESMHVEIVTPNPIMEGRTAHTMPIRLPSTPNNRRLLGFTDEHGTIPPPGHRYDVTIEDGGFRFVARMVVLSFSPNQGYDCLFLLHDGSLYDQMRTDTLAMVASKHKPTGHAACVTGGWRFASMADAMAMMTALSNNTTTPEGALALFPANAGTVPLNERHHYNGSPNGLTASVDRVMEIDGQKVKLPVGFLVTPFVSLRYAITMVYAHYGYEVVDWGVLDHAPWKSIYIINNNYDSIANAEVLLAQLLPDMGCVEFLRMVEMRFNARFVPDSIHRTVSFVAFDTTLSSAPLDISALMVNPKERVTKFPDKASYLSIKNKNALAPSSGGQDFHQPATFDDVRRLSVGASFDPRSGLFYKYSTDGITEKLSAVTTEYCPMDANGSAEAQAKVLELPDTAVAIDLCRVGVAAQVGAGRWLNSYQAMPDGSRREDKAETLAPMLCFAMPTDEGLMAAVQMPGGALSPALPGGTYDAHYRQYASLVSAALVPTKLQVQLPTHLKITLDPMRPVDTGTELLLPVRYTYSSEGNDLATLDAVSLKPARPVVAQPTLQLAHNLYTWQLGYYEEAVATKQQPSYAATIERAKWKPITALTDKYKIYDISDAYEEGVVHTLPAPTASQASSGRGIFLTVVKVKFDILGMGIGGYVPLYVVPALLKDRLADITWRNTTYTTPRRGSW